MRFEFCGCGCWWAASRFYLLFKVTQWDTTRLSVRGAPLSDFFSSQSSISFFSEAWLCAGCVHKVGRMFTCLSSRPEQMGVRGPHNLWSQVQFQAALEKEGKIFKVKFSPQAEKDEWIQALISLAWKQTLDLISRSQVGQVNQSARMDGWNVSDRRVGTFISNRTDQGTAGTQGNREKDSTFFSG